MQSKINRVLRQVARKLANVVALDHATQPITKMSKTTNGLWPKLFDFENLYQGFLEAKKGKRYRPEVMRYAIHAEENIINLQNHLIWKTWQPGKPREFVVKEPKLRLIQAPPFGDRVLHHALVRLVNPIFEKKFIPDSFACRVGKGTQRSVFRLQNFIQEAKRSWGDGVYIIKADISRYFASIRHDILMEEVERTISDPDVLWIWRQIVSGYGHDDGVGIPVGALTSQLGANIILNRLDHIAKDDMGLKYYVRYMDDFVAVLQNKEEAVKALHMLGEAVNGLALSLNPKTAILPWQRGVDFCGYRIWPTHILPRKRNMKRAKLSFRMLAKKYHHGIVDLRHVRQRVTSFLAYTKHCNSYDAVRSTLGDLVLIREAVAAESP